MLEQATKPYISGAVIDIQVTLAFFPAQWDVDYTPTYVTSISIVQSKEGSPLEVVLTLMRTLT